MSLIRIHNAIYNEPWLITPSKWSSICAQFEAHVHGNRADMPMDDAPKNKDMPRMESSAAIIPIHGIIGRHCSMLEMSSGACDLDIVSESVAGAMESKEVDRIILDINSPGGTVNGVAECAQLVGEAARAMPVFAFTDSQCCSAAYWLASQASAIYCTPSAILGSVGVYCIHFDQSRQLENEGIKVNALVSGKMKLAGASFKSMTDEERIFLQARIDKIGIQFRTAISAKRNIDPEILQGQFYDGDECVTNGYADGLVSNLKSLITFTKNT